MVVKIDVFVPRGQTFEPDAEQAFVDLRILPTVRTLRGGAETVEHILLVVVLADLWAELVKQSKERAVSALLDALRRLRDKPVDIQDQDSGVRFRLDRSAHSQEALEALRNVDVSAYPQDTLLVWRESAQRWVPEHRR